MAFDVTQVPSVHKVVVSKRPERKGGSRGLVSGKELFKNTSKFKFAASPRSPSLFLPPFRNDYRGEQASAGIAGIIRMAELGVLDAYLATLAVPQFSDYKDDPGAIKSLFNQFIAYREATDEEFLLWRSTCT